MYSAEYKGIYFVEGMPNSTRVIQDISTEINQFFSQSQLKTLDDVKEQMINVVENQGGNAVVDFRYGQKSSFWKSLIAVDDVRWFASGKIAIINPDEL
jgi:Ni,Fe-hydrogenase III component G